MITLEKTDCCGCSACIEICPYSCISYEVDKGFKYPQISENNCVNCGLCKSVCPVLNYQPVHKPKYLYAAKAKNEEIRQWSSSGGIFSILSDYIIGQGGFVVGVAVNKKNGKVFHKIVSNKQDLKELRGSKYVESDIISIFPTVKEILQKKQMVLFSGTPCQVAGLKRFLRKDYPNLFLIDIICHGVSSPYVWTKYLDYLDVREIISINFRGKRYGWRDYSFNLDYVDSLGETHCISERKEKNIFLKGYAKNLFMRPSCEKCSFKPPKGYSDMTLGDFWGIWSVVPEIDDNKGISVVCVNSRKGKRLLELIQDKIDVYSVKYEDVFYKYNNSYLVSSKLIHNSVFFYEMLEKENIASAVNKYAKRTYKEQLKVAILYVLTKTRLLNIVRGLCK